MAECSLSKGRDCLELDITYKCDMCCRQCDRLCGVCPSTDIMSIGQINKVLRESLLLESPYRKIWVLGGEPSSYPNLNKVVEILDEYRKEVNGCIVRFWTHGWGRGVGRVLESLPSWVEITNSKKIPGVDPPGFNKFLLAPMDYNDLYRGDYRSGCKWIKPGKSGLGVTRHGIYVCAVSGAIDRIVGLDVGLRSLQDVSHRSFEKQCEVLCGYCGHLLVDKQVNPKKESISKTWHRLILEYQTRKPVLTRY